MAKGEFICEVCGDSFWRERCYVARSRRNGQVVTCKRGCSNRLYKKLVTGARNPAWKGGISRQEFTCPLCKGKFVANPRGAHVYCSRQCYHQALSIGRVTPVGPNKRNHFRYQQIAEEKIGRSLRDDEVVHHIDGNPCNNAPENLEVMTAAEHTRMHVRLRTEARKRFEEESLCG